MIFSLLMCVRVVDMMKVDLVTTSSMFAVREHGWLGADVASTIKLGESADERAKAASAAKVQIGKACKFVGQNAIQLHGGMGMTDEMAIGHYFKRATMIEGAFGSTDHYLARYEGLSLGKVA